MPTERRLPIGFLSAHVTAATVHVLSRVSPIALPLSLSSAFGHYRGLNRDFYAPYLYLPVSYLFELLRLCSHFTSLVAPVFFHYLMSFSIGFPPLSLPPVTHSYVLPASALPPGLSLSLPNISSVSPDFELQATLFVSPPHLSLSVSGNRLWCGSLLTSDYSCSQALVETDSSFLICTEPFVRPV